MTMTDAELADIRARVTNATEGDWVTLEHNPCGVYSPLPPSYGDLYEPIAFAESPDDSTFIAHARTDIPALLDELAATRRELAVTHHSWEVAETTLDAVESELAAAREIIKLYAWLWGGKEGDPGTRARAYLHSATEDADERTT